MDVSGEFAVRVFVSPALPPSSFILLYSFPDICKIPRLSSFYITLADLLISSFIGLRFSFPTHPGKHNAFKIQVSCPQVISGAMWLNSA